MASSTFGFVPPFPLLGWNFLGYGRDTCQAATRGDAIGTLEHASGFAPRLCRRTRGSSFATPSLPLTCCEEAERGDGSEAKEEDAQFVHKFDPNSETDAFGRDPKKETEFWMDAAKSVLDSDEVQQAVAEHAEKGGDGLTDEQREYMEFIKSLDDSKSET